MQTIRAIFENGVFRPLDPVQLPEDCTVEFEPRLIAEVKGCNSEEIYRILSERYETGQTDLAERHNEHQP